MCLSTAFSPVECVGMYAIPQVKCIHDNLQNKGLIFHSEEKRKKNENQVLHFHKQSKSAEFHEMWCISHFASRRNAWSLFSLNLLHLLEMLSDFACCWRIRMIIYWHSNQFKEYQFKDFTSFLIYSYIRIIYRSAVPGRNGAFVFILQHSLTKACNLNYS